MIRIAWFITPHGYGHAARSCAVMEALRGIEPEVFFEIYTTIPEWFFLDSLGGGFHYHSIITDIGLVQHGPFEEDLPATLDRLDDFIPYHEEQCSGTISELKSNQVALIVCDVSALGIYLAGQAGIPSLLIENFSWSWIYSGYLDQYPALSSCIDYLRKIEERADFRFQTEPVCERFQNRPLFSPASRKPRKSREMIRAALDISESEPCVLVSLGGIPFRSEIWEELEYPSDIRLIVPGMVDEQKRIGGAVLLPHKSDFYHPDLINASDGVVGKVGYSTLAETYNAGLPFGYILRSSFPESPIMSRFIRERMVGFEISITDFLSGKWIETLPELLNTPRRQPHEENGASLMASRIMELL